MISLQDRELAIRLICKAVQSGARYSKACEILEISTRTFQRWQQSVRENKSLEDQRKRVAAARTPVNKLSDSERAHILDICNLPEYQSLPPSQIVPKLADKGEYIASESSFYRILKEVGQLNRRGKADHPRVVTKPKGFKATAPNQVWSWDITLIPSTIRGLFYRLYLMEDIFSRKIVGWDLHERETSELASDLIKRACLSERIQQPGLVLHSDNGSPMKGATMLSTLQRLGVIPSFSRPSVSDDNPYSESLFRTLKYAPTYPGKPFESLKAARQWVLRFVNWYNNEHLHSGIHFVTPAQRHCGEDVILLAKRKATYALARKKNPLRWSGQTRNWDRKTEVWLNPPQKIRDQREKAKMREKIVCPVDN